ncbi:hypothetical protein [Gordonia rhizosphera]|uniref:Uncharacterized protein n=1 Tax=Gordonia rhizosphera NBRC 16068 TaxID=1108045 RepID=K6W4Z7_9ACTN|nr:hypothetical protein [Gordonia rhizosphera]GAB88776.1 hypothetical protein GORHZ_040_00090 [Gordonia rhizosphera NBRC 16068]
MFITFILIVGVLTLGYGFLGQPARDASDREADRALRERDREYRRDARAGLKVVDAQPDTDDDRAGSIATAGGVDTIATVGGRRTRPWIAEFASSLKSVI